MELCSCGHRASQHRLVGFIMWVGIYGSCLACAQSPEWTFGRVTIRRRRCMKFAHKTQSADDAWES